MLLVCRKIWENTYKFEKKNEFVDNLWNITTLGCRERCSQLEALDFVWDKILWGKMKEKKNKETKCKEIKNEKKYKINLKLINYYFYMNPNLFHLF